MNRKLSVWLCMLFFSAGMARAQDLNISGRVVDAAGDPVVGASVVVKGTTTGVTTGINGDYDISAPSDGTLTFSFLGMGSKEEAVSGRGRIDVTLAGSTQELEEVVVTALGVQRSAKSVGYAVSNVSGSTVQQKAEPDALRALEGKIPGVNIAASSGAAGSATRITIRGNSSFYGNNQPLFVVDGIPYSNVEVTTSNNLTSNAGAYGSGFSTFDPNDVESMNVLKGAAAAALYGSRAANGVVLITTKSGSKNKSAHKGLEVTVSSSVNFEEISALPDYQNTFGQGSDFKYSGANGSWGPAFGGELKKIPIYADYKGLPGMPDSIPYQAYPDNVKKLFNTGLLFDNSVNVQSVNNKGVLNLTVSDLRQKGYIPDSKFERTSFSAGGNTNLENGFRFGGKLTYTMSEQVGGIFGGNQFGGGASSIARSFILPRSLDSDLPYEGPNGEPLFYIGTTQADNPLWSTKHNTITTAMDRIVASVNAGYSIFDYLSVEYQFGANKYAQDREEVIDLYSRGAEGKGRIRRDMYSNTELESNLMVNFNKIFFEDFSVKAVLGQNVNQRFTNRTAVQGLEFTSTGVYNLANTVNPSIMSDATSKRRLVGLYGDVSLGYKSWAFLNFTGRNDWSSTLPKQNNNYFYPAVAGSFVFSDAFKITNKYFTLGRLRASYAMVGNDASPYYVNGTYSTDDAFAGQPTMYVPTTSYDPELKPEFTTEVEGGVELGFFEDRLHADVTLYRRSTTDQIAPMNVAASTQTNTIYTNFGEVKNEGVEIALNGTPVKLSSGFEWELYGTFTKNQSEVVELVEGVEKLTLSTNCTNCPEPTLIKGKPYGYLYGTVFARDEQTGQMLIDPNTGLGIEAVENGELGNPYPDFTFSLGTTFKYKGLFLSAAFDGSIGGLIFSSTIVDYLGRGVTKDTEDRYGTRILPGVYGDPNTGKAVRDAGGNLIPNVTQVREADLWFGGGSFGTNSTDEAATYDATVYRLREVTIGYELPKTLLKKTPFGGISISLTGRNLWFYAPNVPKYTNYDPVVNTFGAGNIQGLEYGMAPSTRRYGINLRFTF